MGELTERDDDTIRVPGMLIFVRTSQMCRKSGMGIMRACPGARLQARTHKSGTCDPVQAVEPFWFLPDHGPALRRPVRGLGALRLAGCRGNAFMEKILHVICCL